MYIFVYIVIILITAGGHYTSQALNPIDKCWYEYDDSWVSTSDEASVSNAEAYLLFYKYGFISLF